MAPRQWRTTKQKGKKIQYMKNGGKCTAKFTDIDFSRLFV